MGSSLPSDPPSAGGGNCRHLRCRDAQPQGEPVAGADKRGMQVEHVNQPEPGTWQAGCGCCRAKPGQRVGGTTAGVVHLDHDAAGHRPDAKGDWRAAMPPCVSYGFGHAKDQFLKPGVRDMDPARRGDGVPSLGCGWFDQVERGRGLL